MSFSRKLIASMVYRDRYLAQHDFVLSTNAGDTH